MPVEISVKTKIAPGDAGSIAEAVGLLRSREPVVLPTETVYGLGCNALDDHAVARIFAVKERPRFNPLIVHVRDWDHAMEYAEPNHHAAALAERFWPGALTLVLNRNRECRISRLASAGLDTVAVRAPSHKLAQILINASGFPIAAPSANRSGRLSPTTAEAAFHELSGRVGLILDGGTCQAGIESTIVGFESGGPVILRPGAIPRDHIEAAIGPLVQRQSRTVSAPGILASHYAPRARLRLNATDIAPGEALLAFGETTLTAGVICNLSPSGELRAAAANLFGMLRRLDDTGADTIAVMPIPDAGLGEAINDRLRRAAAPRDSHYDCT
jgi:L-threonylcarbamoyladenylate synthase